MKITVLNECFLSEKNIADLKSIGELEIYNDTTSEEKVTERMTGKDIVFADMFECPLNQNVISKANGLKLLCLNTTAFDLVDIKTAKDKNIQVTNVSGYSTEAVAEHVFGLLLSLNRRICEADRAMHDKPFQINPMDQSHYKFLGYNLAGKTIGIIGLGAIGSQVAKIANGFGMKVIAYNRSLKNRDNIEIVALDKLFARSDIISIHTPLNEQSENIIDAKTIQKMKDGVVIINTARGQCIVEQDLADALNSGKVSAAGLDKITQWNLDNPLLNAPNTVFTPHNAWFTKEALGNIGNIMTETALAFAKGQPINIVN